MTRRLTGLREEHGVAIVLAVFLVALLSVLGIVLIDTVTSEQTRSSQARDRQAAFEAAESGLNDYIAKLVDDKLYYLHHVAKGESTRRSPGGVLVTTDPNTGTGTTPTDWVFDLDWTYPNGKDAWRTLSNGFEYNLLVTPPNYASGIEYVRVLASGRKTGTAQERVIEAHVNPSSVADWQMISISDICYGSGATTTGKLYAGRDENGTNHSIKHDGTATANVYAEGQVNPSSNGCSGSGTSLTLSGGAQIFDVDSSPKDIRDVLEDPIDFAAAISVSLEDVKRAADVGGIWNLDDYDDAAYDGWRLTFQNSGAVTVEKCKRSGSSNLAQTAPSSCVAIGISGSTVPTNGAIYATKTVIVRGQTTGALNSVKGRVTVASNNDIVVGGSIGPVTPGKDVLGLVALNYVYVATYAADASGDLSWRAGTIAQTKEWRAYSCSPTVHDTMTFTGSTAAHGNPSHTNTGCMSSYATRYYNYDPTLQFLQPPWFPTIEAPYTILLFRELPSGSL